MKIHEHSIEIGYIGAFVVLATTGAIINRIQDRKLSKEGRKLKYQLEIKQRSSARKIYKNVKDGTYTKAFMDQLKTDCDFAKIVVKEV